MDPLTEEVTGFSVKPLQGYENTFSFEREGKRLLEVSTFWRCFHSWWTGSEELKYKVLFVILILYFLLWNIVQHYLSRSFLRRRMYTHFHGCPGQQQRTLANSIEIKVLTSSTQDEKHLGKACYCEAGEHILNTANSVLYNFIRPHKCHFSKSHFIAILVFSGLPSSSFSVCP